MCWILLQFNSYLLHLTFSNSLQSKSLSIISERNSVRNVRKTGDWAANEASGVKDVLFSSVAGKYFIDVFLSGRSVKAFQQFVAHLT